MTDWTGRTAIATRDGATIVPEPEPEYEQPAGWPRIRRRGVVMNAHEIETFKQIKKLLDDLSFDGHRMLVAYIIDHQLANAETVARKASELWSDRLGATAKTLFERYQDLERNSYVVRLLCQELERKIETMGR